MDTTVIGVMKDGRQAEQAVNNLKAEGFKEDEISIVAKEQGQDGEGYMEGQGNQDYSYSQQNLSDGTATGGAIGGIAGLLMGAGALLLPGIGPIVAAGPLSAALTGVVTGGIAGGLIDFGIPEERGKHYEEKVRQGDILVAVKTDDQRVDQAVSILRKNGARDVESHRR